MMPGSALKKGLSSISMLEENVRQMAHEIYQRLLKSELFHTVDEK